MENFIVYALYCPKRHKPVYVGQTTRGVERPFEHIKEQSHSNKVNEWVHNLHDEGLSPVVTILEWTEHESVLQDKETFWIQKLISEGNLLLNQNKVTPVFLDMVEFNAEGGNTLDIALYVKAKRKLNHLTQQQLAEKAGVGLRFIRELEQSTKNNFNTGSIIKILKLFGAKLTVGKM
jgi:hypothetical protein